MNAFLFHRFDLKRAPISLRRALVVFCAAAFVLVSFAHNIHHLSGSNRTVIIDLDSNSSDADSAPSKLKPVTVEYCHGCSLIAVTAHSFFVAPQLVTAGGMTVRHFDEYRPPSPMVDTPPPRLLI